MAFLFAIAIVGAITGHSHRDFERHQVAHNSDQQELYKYSYLRPQDMLVDVTPNSPTWIVSTNSDVTSTWTWNVDSNRKNFPRG